MTQGAKRSLDGQRVFTNNGLISVRLRPRLSAAVSAKKSVPSFPAKIVPLRQVAALIIDVSVCFEARSEQDLPHHLRNHDHADVFAQAFMAAETEVKVVIPVAAGNESVWILKRLWVEHRGLRNRQNIGSRLDRGRMIGALGHGVVTRGLAKHKRRNGNETERLPDDTVEFGGIVVLSGAFCLG